MNPADHATLPKEFFMKKVLFFVVSSLLTITAVAKEDCAKAAFDIAKLNLDSKARAYRFENSDFQETAPKYIDYNAKKDTETFAFDGYIYKASYALLVEVDSSCSVESVKIEEVK
jgi:hypothetical protein